MAWPEPCPERNSEQAYPMTVRGSSSSSSASSASTGEAILQSTPAIPSRTIVLGGEKIKILLLLYCGPNDRDLSLYTLLGNAAFECINYDLKSGQQFDLADDVVWDQILYDIVAGNMLPRSQALIARLTRGGIIFLGCRRYVVFTGPTDTAQRATR